MIGPTVVLLRPAQILSTKYQKVFWDDMERSREVAALEVKLELTSIRTRVGIYRHFHRKSEDESYVIALLDENGNPGPLTRYIVAMSRITVPESSHDQREVNETFLKIARRNIERACVEFLHNENGYREVWGKLLPN